MFLKVLILILWIGQVALAAPFVTCAVQIRISDSDGNVPTHATARLVDPSGKVIATQAAHGGAVEFCDFGFGPHSIIVAVAPCFEATMRGVVNHWHRKQVFDVVVLECDIRDGFQEGCFVYVRVLSKDQKPIQGAAVRLRDSITVLKTDEFGRAMTGLPQGGKDAVMISYGGSVISRPVRCGQPARNVEVEVAFDR